MGFRMLFELSVVNPADNPDGKLNELLIKLTLSGRDEVGIVVEGEEIPPETEETSFFFGSLFKYCHQKYINVPDIFKCYRSQSIQLRVVILQVLAKVYDQFLVESSGLFSTIASLSDNIRSFCAFLDDDEFFRGKFAGWFEAIKKYPVDKKIISEVLEIETIILNGLRRFFEGKKLYLPPELRDNAGLISVLKKNSVNEEEMSLIEKSRTTHFFSDVAVKLNLKNRINRLQELRIEAVNKENTYKDRKEYTWIPFFRSKSNSAQFKKKAVKKIIEQINLRIMALENGSELMSHDDFWSVVKKENKDVYDAANQGTLKKIFQKTKDNIETNSDQDKVFLSCGLQLSQQTLNA